MSLVLQSEQILQSCENSAVGPLEVSPQKKFITHLVEPVELLIVIIVPNVEHGASIDPVGRQEVQTERVVKRIELGDVPEQQTLGELIGCERAEELDVEYFDVGRP